MFLKFVRYAFILCRGFPLRGVNAIKAKQGRSRIGSRKPINASINYLAVSLQKFAKLFG